MSSSSSYLSGGEPTRVKPTATAYPLTFLVEANKACTEAWFLARAGMNNNGAAEFQLVDEYGIALSDVTQSFSSAVSRLKFLNVNIEPNEFPRVVRVKVVNKSTVEHSDASCLGVLLVFKE